MLKRAKLNYFTNSVVDKTSTFYTPVDKYEKLKIYFLVKKATNKMKRKMELAI